MTDEEYEQKYQDALESLKQRGKELGEPYRTRDGVRLVHVDGYPSPDMIVLEWAWGVTVASEIMRERPA